MIIILYASILRNFLFLAWLFSKKMSGYCQDIVIALSASASSASSACKNFDIV